MGGKVACGIKGLNGLQWRLNELGGFRQDPRSTAANLHRGKPSLSVISYLSFDTYLRLKLETFCTPET